MTKDQEWYLQVESVALQTLIESVLQIKISDARPAEAFLFTFDAAYALGFEAAKKMAADGIDIQALNTEGLSLIPNEPTEHAM